MSNVCYLSAIDDNQAPQFVYNPDSQASREELSDELLRLVEDVAEEELELEEWLAHPIYRAVIKGDFKTLNSYLKTAGYHIVSIPVL